MLSGHIVCHRADILKNLQTLGIMGGETNPMAQLAAFLSNYRHLFASDGRGNFSLKDEQNPEPQPAATDSEAGSKGDAARQRHP